VLSGINELRENGFLNEGAFPIADAGYIGLTEGTTKVGWLCLCRFIICTGE